jgi:hypothetical protein
MEMRMLVALDVARAACGAGSHEHGKGSESANLTGRSKATNEWDEMEQQTAGLLIYIRSSVTQRNPPAGDEGTDLPDNAHWLVDSLRSFPTIVPEPAPSLAISAHMLRQSHERYLDDDFVFCVAPTGLKCNSGLLPHAEARG